MMDLSHFVVATKKQAPTTLRTMDSSSSSNQQSSSSSRSSSSRLFFWKRMLLLWTAASAIKVLLMPSYHSTDLYVHRHWKAVTLHIASPANWYFDDAFVPTRHTLDYPPAFAWLEAALASSAVWMTTPWQLDECLALLPSDDYTSPSDHANDATTTTTIIENDVQLIAQRPACKVYLRTTVIASDVVLWVGAWQLAAAATPATPFTTFGLLVFHPALLWLDHVHFQYNGMLLGIWMLSLACLVQSRRLQQQAQQGTTIKWHVYHLAAAVWFALLLTLKHLYLPLALWYLVYLFRAYCVENVSANKDEDNNNNNNHQLLARIHWKRLAILGTVALVTLIAPFLPLVAPSSTTTALYTRTQRLARILARLFPFGRGLVHDYWAGNVWAMYVATQKVLRVGLGRPALPTVSPAVAGIVLVLAVAPGAIVGAWKAAATQVSTATTRKNKKNRQSHDETTFWMSLTWTTLAAFATAYHGHEKAIVTSLIPMTIWAMQQQQQQQQQSQPPQLWVWRTHAAALVSLLPLLYPATETLMKLVSMVLYLAVLYEIITRPDKINNQHAIDDKKSTFRWMDGLCTRLTMVALLVTVVLLEGVPITWWGRFSFAPLALTSLVSAAGLSVAAWGHVGW